MTSHAAWRYLRCWLLVVTGFAGTGAAVNYVVDPYGIYRVVDMHGLNHIKPRAGQRAERAKTHAIELIRPASLILGNSRAEVGFDPEHPGWPQETKPTYNFAVPGTGALPALRNLRYAISVSRPRLVVIGVEFFDFRLDANTPPAAMLKRYAHEMATPVQSAGRRLEDYAGTLFSLDALLDSARTLAVQKDPHAIHLSELGFNPNRQYVRYGSTFGYHSLFRQRNLGNAKSYVRGPKDIFLAGTRDSPDFEMVREWIAACREADIRLHLVIYPYHAQLLETLRLAGLWNAFEDWKRKLAEIREEDAKAHAGAAPYPLWDFSGYNPLTSETVPPAGDTRSTMKWYWEAGHFKQELGDLVLDRVLGHRDPQRPLPEYFGIPLSAQNIEAHLARIRSDQARYPILHRQDAEEISNIVSMVK